MVTQTEIKLPEYSRGFHLITHLVEKHLPELPANGLLHLLLKHTSAGLALNENADPSVRSDFNEFINQLVPENTTYFTHLLEGGDDMPAHIKSSIFGQTLSIPIVNHRLNLGTWQGIYFCEFRENAGPRQIVMTIIS
jgi:secondary thiamine-phosphate synthase enzyme